MKDYQQIGEEAYSILAQFYEYDRDIPLDARVLHRDENEAFTREKVVFRGLHNSRVPGYLTIPTLDSPPYPCVLMAHGLGGSKGDRRSELGPEKASITKELLSSGFAILVHDAPYHGERTFSADYGPIFSFISPNIYRELFVQWAVEYRLATDYLANRPEVDIARLGMLGYSLGGMMAFNLIGVEHRIKTTVTCATLPITPHYINRIGWDETMLAQMMPIAPQNFAPATKSTPFLMLNGKADSWGILEEVQALYGLIGSSTKELVLFDSGHDLPADHMPQVVEWFRQYLK